MEDPAITKAAFNAQFERTCISKYLGRKLSPEGWQCTAVQSAMLALPLSLDSVGEVLNIQRKKLKEGADLVRFFSMPCKPTKPTVADSEPARGRTGEMGTVQNLLYPGCGCGAGDPAETVEISHPRIRNGVVPDGSGDQ